MSLVDVIVWANMRHYHDEIERNRKLIQKLMKS